MDDGVEPVLQVDALAQAVGADEHPAWLARKLGNPPLTLGGREPPGHARDRRPPPKRAPEVLSEVFGGGDEAAEDDRVKAVAHEILDEADRALQLRVGFAG